MAKILACIAICLACLQGGQYLQAEEQNTLLRELSGQKVVPPEGLEEYAELWEDNYIVGFSADWCIWCPAQKVNWAALKRKGYRVKVYDVDEHPGLYAYFRDNGVTEGIPYTATFVEGEIKHRFKGVINWRRIAKKAEDCKKE